MTHKVEETLEKILAVFVWQQPVEEPQGHANERWAFQKRGGSRGAVFSRIAGPREGGGASEVREVNLAGIPQLQMLHEALSFYTIREVNSLSGQAASQPAHTQQ